MLFRAAVVLGVLTALCAATTNVEIINYCHQQIDPGFSPLVNSSNGHTTGGFILESREHATVKLPAGWIGNIWPRTGCDIYGTCETGQCPGGVNCTGIAIPGSDYTRAYFSISRDAHGTDIFAPRTDEGFNVPVRIVPGPGCTVTAVECTADGEGSGCNAYSNCPTGVSYDVIFCY